MEEYAENYVNMPFFNDACDNVVYAMNGLWDTMGEACQEVQQVHSQGNDRSRDTPRGLYESVPF